MSVDGARRRVPRDGIALLVALSLLALLGLLVAGSFAAIVLSSRTSRLAQVDARLDAAAEYALWAPVTDWAAWDLAGLGVGATRSRQVSVPAAPDVRATVSAMRLPRGALWVVADARSSFGEEGHRRLNLLLRLPVSEPLPEAAIVSRGDVRLGPGVRIGMDSAQAHDCASPSAADVALAAGATLTVATDAGAPPITSLVSSAAGDSAVYRLRGKGWSALAGGAGVSIAPADLAISGGTGSGVLLVSGRLTITGPFSYSGLIVALDGVQASAGVSISGALLSFRPPGAPASVDLTESTLVYAPCTVRYALESLFAPRRAGERSWADLF